MSAVIRRLSKLVKRGRIVPVLEDLLWHSVQNILGDVWVVERAVAVRLVGHSAGESHLFVDLESALVELH